MRNIHTAEPEMRMSRGDVLDAPLDALVDGIDALVESHVPDRDTASGERPCGRFRIRCRAHGRWASGRRCGRSARDIRARWRDNRRRRRKRSREPAPAVFQSCAIFCIRCRQMRHAVSRWGDLLGSRSGIEMGIHIAAFLILRWRPTCMVRGHADHPNARCAGRSCTARRCRACIRH